LIFLLKKEQRVLSSLPNLLGNDLCNLRRIHLHRIEFRGKLLIGKVWSFAVVGTDRLTLVTAIYPTVGIEPPISTTTLYRSARDATRSVDVALLDGPIRAGFHTTTTLPAADAFVCCIVTIALCGHHHLAQQYE
jgi:hypothetical protein